MIFIQVRVESGNIRRFGALDIRKLRRHRIRVSRKSQLVVIFVLVKFLWLTLFMTTFIWSAINPADYQTWFLEVIPAMIGLIVIIATYQSFRLTTLLYSLVLIHCIILMVGGHYTYAAVPLFNELKDIFGFERNNYDKLGHFAQGFVPAMIAREILIRKNVFNGIRWRNFFIVCFCLALSACYELIEWWVAVSTAEGAEAFLGTQGYEWDTQSDMLMALLGAITALAMLGRFHDRQLSKLPHAFSPTKLNE